MSIIYDNLEYYLDLLEECHGVEQSSQWHPEGDVLQHTLQVVSAALKESDDPDLVIAALLHDIGKVEHSHGHAERALARLDGRISAKVSWLIENHMRIWQLLMGEMVKKKKINTLIQHPWLPELILLARWDKLGRDPERKLVYDREKLAGRICSLLGVATGENYG